MIAQSQSVEALLDRLKGLSASLEPVGDVHVPFEYPTVKQYFGYDAIFSKYGGVIP